MTHLGDAEIARRERALQLAIQVFSESRIAADECACLAAIAPSIEVVAHRFYQYLYVAPEVGHGRSHEPTITHRPTPSVTAI